MFGRLQREILREVHDHRDEFREERETFRQSMAQMILEMRRNGEAHRAELREIRDEMRESREEFREEMRAQRQALFAVLDRLPPPPGEATA